MYRINLSPHAPAKAPLQCTWESLGAPYQCATQKLPWSSYQRLAAAAAAPLRIRTSTAHVGTGSASGGASKENSGSLAGRCCCCCCCW
jgi:hypothetical protein